LRDDAGEFDIAGGEEDDRAHGFECAVPSGPPLGCLELPVDGFEEAVGLTRLCPGEASASPILS
jgi:hypothetical protein